MEGSPPQREAAVCNHSEKRNPSGIQDTRRAPSPAVIDQIWPPAEVRLWGTNRRVMGAAATYRGSRPGWRWSCRCARRCGSSGGAASCRGSPATTPSPPPPPPPGGSPIWGGDWYGGLCSAWTWDLGMGVADTVGLDRWSRMGLCTLWLWELVRASGALVNAEESPVRRYCRFFSRFF